MGHHSKIRENIMFLTKNTAKTRGVKTSSELRIAVGQWQFCENYGPVVMEMTNLVPRAMPVRGLARAQALLWVIELKYILGEQTSKSAIFLASLR